MINVGIRTMSRFFAANLVTKSAKFAGNNQIMKSHSDNNTQTLK